MALVDLFHVRRGPPAVTAARLCPPTFCTFLRELPSASRTPHPPSGVEQRQRIADDRPHENGVSPQRHSDRRLRDLVRRIGDLTIATDLGVPRSTARGWLRKAPRVAITVDVTNVKTRSQGHGSR